MQDPKICFIVTSVIEVDNSKPWDGAARRSFFTREERMFQTKRGLANLREKCPTAKIYLVEGSKSYFEELDDNIEYVHLENLNPVVADIVRNDGFRAKCEALMIKEFLTAYLKELQQYDFIVKYSGRSMLKTFSNKYFVSANRNKLLLKKLSVDPNFLNIAPSHIWYREGNKLFSFHTVLMGIGIEKLGIFQKYLDEMIELEKNPAYSTLHTQMEALLVHMLCRDDLISDVVFAEDWRVLKQFGIYGMSAIV